jgi:hypothetical protein
VPDRVTVDVAGHREEIAVLSVEITKDIGEKDQKERSSRWHLPVNKKLRCC